MKAKLLVGFIYLFILSNLSIAQETTLSLNAVFGKPEYRVGQPVILTVIITNNSYTAVYVRWATASVKVEAGGESLFKPKGMTGSRGEAKELKPGDTWPNELAYTIESFTMPASGNYQATITYKNGQEEGRLGSGTGRKGEISHKLWMGEVKTTAVLKIID